MTCLSRGPILFLVALLFLLCSCHERRRLYIASPVEQPTEQVDNTEEIARGERLFMTHGCTGCHTIDGISLVGPSIHQLFGSVRTLNQGQEIVADENYIRESIVLPNKKVVQGFSPNMPSYDQLLTDEELDAIILYIKSI